MCLWKRVIAVSVLCVYLWMCVCVCILSCHCVCACLVCVKAEQRASPPPTKRINTGDTVKLLCNAGESDNTTPPPLFSISVSVISLSFSLYLSFIHYLEPLQRHQQ